MKFVLVVFMILGGEWQQEPAAAYDSLALCLAAASSVQSAAAAVGDPRVTGLAIECVRLSPQPVGAVRL